MRSIRRPLMVVTCLAVAVIISASRFYKPSYPTNHIVNLLSEKRHQFICEGFIKSLPKADIEEQRTKLLVDLAGCKEGEELRPVGGTAQLTVNAVGLGYSYGDVVRFKSSLRLPANFENPGGFDFERFCLARGIDALGFVAEPAWVTKVGVVSGHPFRMWIEGFRERLALEIGTIDDARLKGLVRALVIGDGSQVPKETEDDFRASGLMHLLVISGLNIAFVALAVFFILKWALLFLVPSLAERYNIFKPAALATIAIVWFYSMLTGAEVSVVRAAIMATVYLAGMILERRQDIFTSLAFAAVIILAISPLAVFDVSFQLSFVTVIAIAAVYPALINRLKLKNGGSLTERTVALLAKSVAVSLAASIGAVPLLAYYFHYSSMAGLFANIIAVPYAGFVITPANLLMAFVGIVWQGAGEALATMNSWLVWPLMRFAGLTAGVSSPVTLALSPPVMSIVGFYALVIVSVSGLRKRKLLALAACVAFRFAGFAFQRGWFLGERLRVTFLDVGQGSSIFVGFPNGRTMMIDGGGFKDSDFDIGKNVIAPYLWNKGISKIDYIMLTHQHPDHFKGLAFIFENFRPEMFYWSGIAPGRGPAEDDSTEWDEFLKRIEPARAERRDAAGEFVEGGAVVRFLPPNNSGGSMSMNNASIVTRISYGDNSFLLAGDIEREREEEILRGGLQSATVLQVPHHGSSTSSTREFLSAVRPRYAVIQAGRNNRYGFPTAQTLERLKEIGAQVLRTDQKGAVEFSVGVAQLLRVR